jgi:predicted HAD superfamily Cof-like phosphohydrolase
MIDLIKLWFKRAVPNPTPKNQAVQMGVHMEEFVEMLDQLTYVDGTTIELVHREAEHFKHAMPDLTVADRVELLDSLCDQIVTATGVAHMLGMDIEGALKEVNRSNWSKFDDEGNPLFDKNGKIKKGPNYTPPELEKFV